MTSQCGVVRLNIELEVATKAILVQECHYRLSIIIILMAGRLLGFGLDQ